ncbi:MAG: FG-GAP-like repeat-containing protein [Pyrinomonadaceae bacterium]
MKKRSCWKSIKILAVSAMLALWVSVPLLTDQVKADSSPVILVRTATLISPSGTVNPHGEAEWQLYQSGNREIEVEVEDLSLSMGTSLTAVVDGNVVGQMTVDDRQKARLKLKTEDGQAVPVVDNGSTVQVLNGSTVLVSGVFGGGGATPTPSVSPSGSPSGSPSPSPSVSPSGSPSPSPSVSPSPSPSPNAGDLFAGLTGPTVNGVLPTGFASYEIHSSRTELEVRVRQVNLPIGTNLSVLINGVPTGSMSVESGGEGRLRLRSDNGQTVPVIIPGDSIDVRNTVGTILSGTFSFSFGPTPSPSPTSAGTPGPTPSPSPGLGRSFETQLTGSGVTPPVSTAATGEINVSLNASEDQATVFGEFHGLASNQSGARIETTVGSGSTIRDLGVVGGRNGNFPSVTFAVTAAQVQQLRAGLWSAVILSVNEPNGEIRGSFKQRSGESDLNGDGLSDFAVFRPSTSVWYASNTDGYSAQTFGSSSDRLVSADYDGDGKTDIGVYRNDNGLGVWDIKRSSDNGITSTQWGLASDVPVRGDFDGDGRFDLAVFRPSNGVWYIQNSNNTGYTITAWGLAEDLPAPADMDGDGKDDLVVFRPSNGSWYWLRSSDGQFAGAAWGLNGDIPTPGDFDGDGKSDVAVFRPSTGVWYWFRTSDGNYAGVQWGITGDIPVAGNYDHDGKTDIAVFRPSDGTWYVLNSSDGGYQFFNFGLNGDIPLKAR